MIDRRQKTDIQAHRWVPFYFQTNIFNLILESISTILQSKKRCQALIEKIYNFQGIGIEFILSNIPIIHNAEDKVQKLQKKLDILNRHFISYHQYTMNTAHSFFLFELIKYENFMLSLNQIQIGRVDLKLKKYLQRYMQVQYFYLSILLQFPLQILNQQQNTLQSYCLKVRDFYQPPERIAGALNRNFQMINQIYKKYQNLYLGLFPHLDHIPRIQKPSGLFKKWSILIAANIIVLVIIISAFIFCYVNKNQDSQLMNDFNIWKGSISYILYLWAWTCGLYFFQCHNIYYWMIPKQRKIEYLNINSQKLFKITILLNSTFIILFFFYMLFMVKVFSSSIFHPQNFAIIMQFIMLIAFGYFNLASGQFQLLKQCACYNIFLLKQIISLIIPFRDFIFSCCSIMYQTSQCRLNLTVNIFQFVYILLPLFFLIIAQIKQNNSICSKIRITILYLCYILLTFFGFLNQINLNKGQVYIWYSICIFSIVVYILGQLIIECKKSNQQKQTIIFSIEYFKIFPLFLKLLFKLICHLSFCLIISFDILVRFTLLTFFAQCILILAIGIQNIVQLETQYINKIEQFQSIPKIQMDIQIVGQVDLQRMKIFLKEELQIKQLYEKEQLNIFYFSELEQDRDILLKQLALIQANIKQIDRNQTHIYHQIDSMI